LGPLFTLEKLSHWYHSLNITRRRGELAHQFFLLFVLVEPHNVVIVTGGEDGKIQMWKDTPLDLSGLKDVDGDLELMTAPEAF